MESNNLFEKESYNELHQVSLLLVIGIIENWVMINKVLGIGETIVLL